MPATVVVGMVFGDEGKAKVIDHLASDIVVRYQGGANAGHTIVVGNDRFVAHQIPSGILRKGVMNVIGNGMVVDLEMLAAEMDDVTKHGGDPERSLMISSNAHLVLPWHKDEDKRIEERLSKEKNAVGTTLKGIGPTYTTKSQRCGIRAEYLLDDNVLRGALERFALIQGETFDKKASFEWLTQWRPRVLPLIQDTVRYVNERLAKGAHILLEGAQGTMLDYDHGTYPFVTSSNCTVGGACTGAGIPPQAITRVVGIMKAYATRVGSGPFPTEDEGERGQLMRKTGKEFGSTTGRARRCGEQDLVEAAYAVMVNGITEIALVKLDVLDQMDEIKAAHEYHDPRKDEYTSAMPLQHVFTRVKPMYTTMKGWRPATVAGVREYENLPEKARDYVGFIESALGRPITMISTSPERDDIIVRS
ncbi:MAG: adenylosuccinate synthase [Nanoarchaeota archaeon]